MTTTTKAPAPRGTLVLFPGEETVEMCCKVGLRHVLDATHQLSILDRDRAVRPSHSLVRCARISGTAR